MIFATSLPSPDLVTVITDQQTLRLQPDAQGFWENANVCVSIKRSDAELHLRLSKADVPVQQVICSWNTSIPGGTRFLNDHWERGYGDLEWSGLTAERIFPWHLLAHTSGTTWGVGVQTQPAAFCYWRMTPIAISLVCDVRSGVQGVLLNGRELAIATIVTNLEESANAFAAATAFCRKLCPAPRLPGQPVYGFNDWYYAYGRNTRDSILRDARFLAEVAPPTSNRPFCVIDAGWQMCGGVVGGAPWDRGNALFGDMAALAREIKHIDIRPGLWARLLYCHERVPPTWVGRETECACILDPSVPEVLAHVAQHVRRFPQNWGYDLLKHDFSSYDIFGLWGFEMGTGLTGKNVIHIADRSRTTAEIILDLYRTIRAAAGDAIIIGCNTISHLAAGLLDVQRTGDDTSGQEWSRTRKMGVNTLAFRMPQHNTFYVADADCVGLTTNVPWHLNQQWLELLAYSGTPLFISAAQEAVGPEQRAAIRAALQRAAQPQPPAEPLDWMDTTTPADWRFGETETTYDWFQE